MKCAMLLMFLISLFNCILSARILALLPMPAKSHHILFHAVLNTLAERGHQVLSYTAIPSAKPTANYTFIHLHEVESTDKSITAEKFKAMLNISPIGFTTMIFKECLQMLDVLFQNRKIQELLESREQFDLIFIEASFGNEPLLAFGHKFKAPVISLHPFGSFSLINYATGNPLSLVHIPDFSLPFTNHMSFYERLVNSYSTLTSLYSYHMEYLPSLDKYTRKIFNDPTLPSVVDMLKNVSLFVNNAHPNVHYAQPYVSKLISVGGIHLSKERNPLPVEIKKFIDEAENGVIYFSMGSVIPDHLLPTNFFDNFINVFRRLPYRVLWKIGRDIKELPDNIMTAKWMPQQDILNHPNVVLFVTHGGLFSQHEAISSGVPVVCIPIFGDQPMNARFYEAKKIGVKILFNELSEETISTALNNVLKNPKYKDNMAKLTRIYQDRHMSAADTLVFWVEYVLRHGGAQHLKPASALIPWYQLFLLDVITAILLIVTTVLIVLCIFTRKIYNLVKRNLNTNVTNRKKKN